MRVTSNGVLVGDQDQALRFYTEVLSFVKKQDIPMGKYRWLTLVSPEGPDDIELTLEPNSHPAAKAYQTALYGDGIPLTSFVATNVQAEYERLTERGVAFRTTPTQAEPMTITVFEDTCGNLIQLHQI